jgi:photosystem II stability/assembly factor-like uncharacterized protein
MNESPEAKAPPPAVPPPPSKAEAAAGASPPASPVATSRRATDPLLYMPRWWRNTTALTLLLLLALATWFAAKQAPHSDMFRPIGLWEMGRADWWAYPLERNAFKRMVVRGDLSSVYALPDGQHIWAVGEAGLIIHSGDGGRTWQQQRPVRGDANGATRSASLDVWLGWLPSAQAQSQSSQPNDLQKQQQLVPANKAADTLPNAPANVVVRPVSPDEALKAAATATAVSEADLKKAQAPRRVQPVAKKVVAAPAGKAVAKAASAPVAGASSPEVSPPPRPSGEADLTSVYFVSATTGWAVGSDGAVLATRNGGGTWVAQNSGSRAWLSGVHFASDGLSGWAIGGAGTVLSSQDGGNTWVAQNSGVTTFLTAVHFARDARTGWIVGMDGTALGTRDGGATWTALVSGTDELLYGVFFADDARRGWAVGSSTVRSTSDGGQSWVVQSSGTREILSAVHFLSDARTGWAVGRGGALQRTRDGGKTWVESNSGTTSPLAGVRFSADGISGWVVGDDGTLLSTHDGGDSWVAQSGGNKVSFNGLHFAGDMLRGWVVGNDGTLLSTRDGGSIWSSQSGGSRESLNAVRFADDALRGWAVGGGGTVLQTRDGGSNWVVQASGTKQSLYGVHFADDALKGWVVGTAGTVLSTGDAGIAWTKQVTRTITQLHGVYFGRDALTGWVVGPGGTVLGTRDAGSTWSVQASGSTEWLRGVRFADDARDGWVVGGSGKVLHTSDGGNTWRPQRSGTAAGLNAVHVADDARRVWAAGDGGTVLSTRDGGNTWVTHASGTGSFLTAVQFAGDAQRGWAVGDRGTVLRTLDGGSTWNEPAQYRIYWAPWYFALLTVVLAMLAALVALVEPSVKGSRPADVEATPGGAATTLSSDQPVLDKTADRLGYSAAVEALSSFIRNRATEPRVTIAVSGEWGTGKSSIMRMLQSDLESAGFRTAWFNAWHQQQEGRQLTALFNTIRSQAVPRWWGSQFVAALRVRSRLIWGRGLFYKLVAVASAAGCALLLGDLLGDGASAAWANLRANVQHHVLQQQQTAITGASLAKLDPTHKPAPAAAASAPTGGVALPQAAAPADPCTDDARRRTHRKAEPVRLAVYCALKRNYVWDQGEDGSRCGVDRPTQPDVAKRCIFDSAADLIATLDKQDKDGVQELWPSEKTAIRAAAETLPPPPLFRWLENSLLGGLAGFIAILFTKGVSVYGLQLMAPLRALLAGADKDKDSGKESAGTVERYRGEFGLLCDALDGRLVIFIDDLDRCAPATVNGILEMTNYLADVGRCFVVIGAAIERVKASIVSPVGVEDKDAYANEYLRKLIHIELPVPLRRAELEELLRDRKQDAAAPFATRWRRFVQIGFRVVCAAAVVGALGGIFAIGKFLHDAGNGTDQHILPRPLAQVAGERVDAAPASALDAPLKAPTLKPEPTAREVGLSASASPARPWSAGVVGLLVVAAGLAWRWYRRNRDSVLIALGGALRPLDSNEFMQALRIWNPVVIEHDPTPRHVKRFYNRARLFAAYANEEARATGQAAADDAALVAMAALHHVEPAYLERMRRSVAEAEASHADLGRVLSALPAELGLEQSTQAGATAFAQCFVTAWRAHLSAFKQQPSSAQIQSFMDRVRGIHVR